MHTVVIIEARLFTLDSSSENQWPGELAINIVKHMMTSSRVLYIVTIVKYFSNII